MMAQKNPGSSVYFIADAHLVPHPDDVQRAHEDQLLRFLRGIREDAEALYIVGDLFDFWFEYRTAVPKTGARILFELYNLVQSGIRVICLPGNHDIWIGSYLQDQVGIELPGGPISVEHQGLKLFLAHGDEFRTDWKFRLSRAVLKSPFCVACFRVLHPDAGGRLAAWTSSLSEHRMRITGGRNIDSLRDLAERKLADGPDAFLCGHFHLVTHETLDGGSLIVLGDWVKHNTYAKLQSGRLELLHWESSAQE